MRRVALLLLLATCDRGAVKPTAEPEPEPAPASKPRAPDGLPGGPVPGFVPETVPTEPKRTGPYDGDYFDGDRPGSIQNVKFIESPKGKPKTIGCADGQREGFADLKRFPEVAGCLASWDHAPSLRAPARLKGCGDDAGDCDVPASACAAGWHVCGANGSAKDLASRLSGPDCASAGGPGRFNAAMSHMPNDEINPCPQITPATRLPCVQAGIGSEPVCCGDDCLFGKCKDGVWPSKTRISRGTSEGCGAVTSERNGGVLCCKNPAVSK